MTTIEQNSSIINDDILVFNARKNAKSIKTGMQIYENRTLPTKIPENRPFIIRLNSTSFTKMNFINNKKAKCSEFESSYSLAIINTARALLNDTMFKPRLVYTVADEIIMLFNKAEIHQGSTQKYLSILSSKAASYFAKFFKHSDQLEEHTVFFEGRMVFFPDDKNYEIVNYFLWRSGQRNVVNEFYRAKGNKTFLVNKKNTELIQLYKDQFNTEMDESVLPMFLKYGLFMKKCLYSACYITEINASVLSESNVVHVCDAIWSMQFKYGNDIMEEMLSKYYNQDKWEIISHKSTTKYWKSYNSETFDVSEEETEIQQAQNCPPIVCLGQKEDFSDMYMIIPGVSFLLLFMHCFKILTNSPITSQLYDLTLVGFVYSNFLSVISNKTKKHIKMSQLFWTIMLTLLNFAPFYNFIFYKNIYTVLVMVSIVYGYYITIMVGIYLFYYVVAKKDEQSRYCLRFKSFIQPKVDADMDVDADSNVDVVEHETEQDIDESDQESKETQTVQNELHED